MELEVLESVQAVHREVIDRQRDGLPARVVLASRTYDAGIDDVWDALTNIERIPRWFLPISGDLRLGGRYQLEGNAGGEITRCEPPKSFNITWEFGGGVTWLEIRLAAVPEGTRFELEHTAHIDPQWGQFGPGAVGVGWDLGIMGLGKHLASGASVDPAEAAAWLTSENGKQYVRAVADDWARAAIAAGDDEAAARAGADLTFDAYTAGPPQSEA